MTTKENVGLGYISSDSEEDERENDHSEANHLSQNARQTRSKETGKASTSSSGSSSGSSPSSSKHVDTAADDITDKMRTLFKEKFPNQSCHELEILMRSRCFMQRVVDTLANLLTPHAEWQPLPPMYASLAYIVQIMQTDPKAAEAFDMECARKLQVYAQRTLSNFKASASKKPI